MANPPSDTNPFGLHGLSRKDAYHKIDYEISQLQERLSALKTLRNSLAPISQIPTEILSKIFSQTQEHTVFSGDLDVNTRFFVSWVCRHWRTVALATPSLWTVILQKYNSPPIRTDLVEELLLRSCNRELAIDLSNPSAEVLSRCIYQMARMQNLKLSLSTPRSASAELDRLFLQPAPVLLSLELRNPPYSPPFSGNYPCLRHLAISHSDWMILPSLIIPTLTSLRLTNNLSMRIKSFVDTLAMLPNLTELAIIGSLKHEDVLSIPESRISLPSLQEISISNMRSATLFGFLKYLHIPQTAINILWNEETDPTCYAFRHISSTFNNYRNQISFRIRHLKINNSPPHLLFHVSHTSMQHRYSFQFPSLEPVDDYIDGICSQLYLQEVTSLSTNEFSHLLFDTFRQLPGLRTIVLDGKAALEDFISQITPNFGAIHRMPFSAVEELVIGGVCGDEVTRELDQLYRILTARKSAGIGLEKLVFAYCLNMDANRFKDLVNITSELE